MELTNPQQPYLNAVRVDTDPFSQDGTRVLFVASDSDVAHGCPDCSNNLLVFVFDVSLNDWVFQKSFSRKPTGDPLQASFFHQGQYVATTWQTDYELIFANPNHYELTMWDLSSGNPLWKHNPEEMYLHAVVKFAPDDEQVFFGTIDGGSSIFQVNTGERIRQLDSVLARSTKMKLHPR